MHNFMHFNPFNANNLKSPNYPRNKSYIWYNRKSELLFFTEKKSWPPPKKNAQTLYCSIILKFTVVDQAEGMFGKKSQMNFHTGDTKTAVLTLAAVAAALSQLLG